MRMAGAVTLAVLIIQVLLAGAFAVGWYWFGGVQWGLFSGGLLLLLIVAPWTGELKMVFDSDGPRGALKIGWWGRVSFIKRDSVTQVIVRILGIPIRRRIEKKHEPKECNDREPAKDKKDETPAAEPWEEAESKETGSEEGEEGAVPADGGHAPPEGAEQGGARRRVDSDTVEAFWRVIAGGLGTTCELIWGAEEITVVVDDVVESEVADTVIAQVFGRREVGPADLTLRHRQGRRRVRAIYRIGLLRAVLAGLQVAIDGRVRQFLRRMKQQKHQGQVVDEERRIIERIIEKDALRKEDNE